MKIAVFGAGGIGGYFGARLAQAGDEVALIARGPHLAAIRVHGLFVESPTGDFHITPSIATDCPSEVGVVDAVLLGVKAWDVSAAAEAIRPMVGSITGVLTLQNGVEAPMQVAEVLGQDHVMVGLRSSGV
jgi:2-dehydropantoate 2-reductase